MEGITYGYARVSTKEQNLDRQLWALAEFGVSAGTFDMWRKVRGR